MKDLHCVHLDFHTSEKIKDIGGEFDKEEFIAALKTARLDSISIFAKCHHGCFYYESEKFFTHPYLKKLLLDLQVEACKEAGVSSKIYISAGFDEYSARENPQWLLVKPDGTPQNMLQPKFHRLCFNTPYLDLLVAQTEEVVERYMPDGIFLDIIGETPCACRWCRESMEKAGLDWKDPEDLKKQARITYRKMTDAVTEAAKKIKPDVMTFFNAGAVPTGNMDYVEVNDQLELEALPTGGWGYDYFPAAISYARRLGKNCIGMTGKFHKSWGEFGGYKYKDALLYEGAQCVAFDAGLCVGDQLHPSGKVDAYTYENVGNAVSFMEKYEPYRGGDFVPELAVLSRNTRKGTDTMKTGLCRMLFEAKYLFDVISVEEISNKYPLIILADSETPLDRDCAARLREYAKNGGKMIAMAKAPLLDGQCAFDLGCEIIGEDTQIPAYLQADYKLDAADGMALLIKEGIQMNVTLAVGGACLAHKLSPYFVRETVNFCSHSVTPCDYKKKSCAITEGKDGIYVCADLFREYAIYGSLNPKQLFLPLVEKLLDGKKIIKTNLPSSGKAVLYKKGESLFLHLLYANTVKRGDGVEVIEDIVTLADINVSIDVGRKITKIIARPENKELEFTVDEASRINFTLDKFKCYQVIELI